MLDQMLLYIWFVMRLLWAWRFFTNLATHFLIFYNPIVVLFIGYCFILKV